MTSVCQQWSLKRYGGVDIVELHFVVESHMTGADCAGDVKSSTRRDPQTTLQIQLAFKPYVVRQNVPWKINITAIADHTKPAFCFSFLNG